MGDAAEDDLLLTAYLDDELDASERQALAVRLAAEPDLTARLEALRGGRFALQAAFEAALGAAPAHNLAAKLRGATGRAALRGVWRSGWAAGLAALAFAAGVSAARWTKPAQAEDWRDTVAEYMALYTPSSFAPQEEATLDADLRRVSQGVDVELIGKDLRVGAVAPRSAVMLQFRGAPLAQIGYVADGQPLALCIVRDGEPDAEPRAAKQGRFNAVSWAKAGRGYMAISALPADRLEELVRSLRRQSNGL